MYGYLQNLLRVSTSVNYTLLWLPFLQGDNSRRCQCFLLVQIAINIRTSLEAWAYVPRLILCPLPLLRVPLPNPGPPPPLFVLSRKCRIPAFVILNFELHSYDSSFIIKRE